MCLEMCKENNVPKNDFTDIHLIYLYLFVI